MEVSKAVLLKKFLRFHFLKNIKILTIINQLTERNQLM